MDYNKKLIELNSKKQEIINKALEDGYVFDDKNNIFLEKDKQLYFIHILINTIGVGESLGHFELYDKVFPVDRDFAIKSSAIDNLDDFMDKVLFSKVWDKDFEECTVLEDVYSSDWFCYTTEDSHYDNFENIITFRFSYIDSTMGNVTIMKCNPSILENHKNIYHYTKNYVLE